MEEYLKELFARVIEDNKQRILRICRVYAPDKEDQKDLYQEIVLNIWKGLPSFRNDSKVDTWLYRICLNVCIQYSLKLRKARVNRIDIEGITISAESVPPQEDEDLKRRTAQMYVCISGLKEAEKSLILLYLEDLSYQSIAEIAGITENHVAVKISRIKKKLFNCINK
jgi:RNA polymerase sigma-70 factor (ECF subfamily)